jgi:hypothetical protein
MISPSQQLSLPIVAKLNRFIWVGVRIPFVLKPVFTRLLVDDVPMYPAFDIYPAVVGPSNATDVGRHLQVYPRITLCQTLQLDYVDGLTS